MHKVKYIHHHIKHHSNHSGYNRILDYVDNDFKRDGFVEKIYRKIPYKVKDIFLKKSQVKWYNVERLLNETIVMSKGLGLSKEVYHFLYGDDSYCFSGMTPRLSNKKLVATFHQPPKLFDEFIKRKNHIQALDAVIVVGSNLKEHLQKITGKDNVYVVPHGIDLEFFKPLEDENRFKEKRCLFVGQWLRDFETLVRVIEIVNKNSLDVHFDVVSFEDKKSHFENFNNVTFYSSTEESKLLELYQKASLLVLPLTDCTANNSVLEAMACGLPILTTRVGGVMDYVDEHCAALTDPKDAHTMAKRVLDLFERPKELQAMSLAARKRSKNFSWLNVKNQLEDVYRNLFK